ncbi:MAG: hypothetical protein RL701_5194, partial [Pseudomonadota bacterium]
MISHVPTRVESPVNQALTLPGIGDLIDGRFRIDRKLGEGGSSTVYQVSHIITDKKFAIKWLLPELALDEGAVDRFIHEARVGGKFAHPYAVQVYDICKANDSFYMLMELLEGESLQSRLERMGRLPVQTAARIISTCCEVIAAAHRAGIIHRDLKPANIFLCAGVNPPAGSGGSLEESPKLLDFGISTFCPDLHTTPSSASPGVIGTPLYMAPEQMLGQVADQRTDIYAIGAMLYELVSGNPPFQAETYSELARKVTVDAHAIPLDEQLAVEPEFAELVAKAMARDPADRFVSVVELMKALAPFARSPRSPTGLAWLRDTRSLTSTPRARRTAAGAASTRSALVVSGTGLERVPSSFSPQHADQFVSVVAEPRASKRWPRAAVAMAGTLGAVLIVGWGASGLQVASVHGVERAEHVLRPRELAETVSASDELPEFANRARAGVSNVFALKTSPQLQHTHDDITARGSRESAASPSQAASSNSATPSVASHRAAARPKHAPTPAVHAPAPTPAVTAPPSTPTARSGGPFGVSIKRSDFAGSSERPAPMPSTALLRKD